MAGAFVADAVRTPAGRRGGGLAGAHPADLGAHVIGALLARTGVDPVAVDGVVCGSSQQAVHFAAQAVLSGTADLVVAGGVQNCGPAAGTGW